MRNTKKIDARKLPLTLRRESLRTLSSEHLALAVGGVDGQQPFRSFGCQLAADPFRSFGCYGGA
jgi:hypothetical protein